MKTILCTRYGPPEVLKFAEVENPVPDSNEILIKIKATTVTVADSRIRSFRVPAAMWIPARIMLGLRKPKKQILGVELAGTVEAIGENVTRFKIGDHVFAASLKTFGAYAQYKCLPETDPVAIQPNNITAQQAAALPIGARTALYFLEKANLKAGQKILIYGASGSVGSYAVQIANIMGAHVTGVCGTSNIEMVKSLGATHVLDYTSHNFINQLNNYDVVFDAVDKLSFSLANKIIQPGGTYINCTNPIKSFIQRWVSLTTHKKIIMSSNVTETPDYLIRIKQWVEQGTLRPVIDKVYAFNQIVEAHHYVDKGHKKGNVVVEL